jgi:hypothetical protein
MAVDVRERNSILGHRAKYFNASSAIEARSSERDVTVRGTRCGMSSSVTDLPSMMSVEGPDDEHPALVTSSAASAAMTQTATGPVERTTRLASVVPADVGR